MPATAAVGSLISTTVTDSSSVLTGGSIVLCLSAEFR
jgi:hypothetical protein